MKKFILMVAAAMMTAMSVNAQNEELKNEISLSYGFGSTTQLGNGIGEGLAMALLSNEELDDGFILGPISVEYFRHLNNPRIAIGGLVSYSKWDSDELTKGDHQKVGERKRNYFSVMPAFKYYWVNKNNFALYSKAAVGVGFFNCSDKDIVKNTTKDDNGTYFMFQASFIGVEFGGKLRGFAEAGFGEQGFILAGVRYKF